MRKLDRKWNTIVYDANILLYECEWDDIIPKSVCRDFRIFFRFHSLNRMFVYMSWMQVRVWMYAHFMRNAGSCKQFLRVRRFSQFNLSFEFGIVLHSGWMVFGCPAVNWGYAFVESHFSLISVAWPNHQH